MTPTFVWQEIASGEQGPGPRSRHCLVHDRGMQAIILFGGIIWDDQTLCSDTWELQDASWSWVETAQSPPARHRGAMVYDGRQGYSVLFGGQASTGKMLDDTWIYTGRRWRQWKAWWWGRQPSPRCGHSFAFDEQIGVAVLFGGITPKDLPLGDTWLFARGAWRQVLGPAPPPRRYAAFAYDPDLKGCLLYGGSEDDAGRKGYQDVWLFRDLTWTRLPRTFEVDVRDDHGLAYHQAAKVLVMLEGIGGARGVLVRQDRGWQKVEVSPLHPRHQCSPLVWDEQLNGLVYHGGEVRHGGPQFDTTWVLRLVASPELNPGSFPRRLS